MSSSNSNSYSHFDDTGTYIQGELETGDTAWMLTATALVLLMTIPGLAIYYSGMLQHKNVLACEIERSAIVLKMHSKASMDLDTLITNITIQHKISHQS